VLLGYLATGRKEAGMPTWVWILIGGAAVVVVVLIAPRGGSKSSENHDAPGRLRA
jgi:ABC-type branched-subunit amino acid transport system permease subunit